MFSASVISRSGTEGEMRQTKRSALLLGTLATFAPLLVIGIIGERLGDDTVLGAVALNIAYVMSVLVATAVLKWFGVGWRDIGMARPSSWLKTTLLGVGALVVFIIAGNVIGAAIQYLVAPDLAAADKSNYNPLVGNLPLLIIMVSAAWTTVAFGEEMLFRGFLTNMLAEVFPHSKARWAFALVGSSLVFGLAHFSWGLAGIIETIIFGFIMGFVYLRSGRNLWVTIIAHGIANTVSFILIYSGVIL